jgi:hypothetical protein
MVSEHGRFQRPKGLKFSSTIFENFESLDVFCFSKILLKVSKL